FGQHSSFPQYLRYRIGHDIRRVYYVQLRINPFYIFTDKRIMGTSQHQGVQSIVTDKIIHIILYSQIHDIIVDDPFLYQWHEGGTRRLEYVETAAVSSDAGLIRLAGYSHLRPDYTYPVFFCTPFGYGPGSRFYYPKY